MKDNTTKKRLEDLMFLLHRLISKEYAIDKNDDTGFVIKDDDLDFWMCWEYENCDGSCDSRNTCNIRNGDKPTSNFLFKGYELYKYKDKEEMLEQAYNKFKKEHPEYFI